MESYRTEEEQVEALKRWWDENGRSTLIGIALALGLGFGWQAWQQNREQSQNNASALYQQMLEALSQSEEQGVDPAKELALQLKDEYRGSTYAQFAALHLARLEVYEDDLAGAERELRWVMSMAEVGSETYQVAQLRLARVAAAQGDRAGALGMLSGADTDFAASYAQARGDILLADGREAEALIAYETARAALTTGSPLPRTLEEKIAYLSARLSPSLEETVDGSLQGLPANETSMDDSSRAASEAVDLDGFMADDSAANAEAEAP